MPSYYTVQKGDTLSRIAMRFYRSASRYPVIAAANGVVRPDRLRIGQVLFIPDLAPAVPSITPVQRLTEKRLGTLHPVVAQRGRHLIKLVAEIGLTVLVTDGLRSWKEQDALYARGRTVPPIGKAHIITQARGGHSWHNFGLAFDVVLLDAVGKADWNTRHPGWKALGALGKSIGLEWGGDWIKVKDYAHFQYTGGLSLEACRRLAAGGLDPVWDKVA